MKTLSRFVALSLLSLSLFIGLQVQNVNPVENDTYDIVVEDISNDVYEEVSVLCDEEVEEEPEIEPNFISRTTIYEEMYYNYLEEQAQKEQEPEYGLTDEEIDLIALVTMAEAEGECELGKRLVIDTILNRVDHEHWANNVYDVIYQPEQFACMWNGRIDVCYVQDDIRELVKEELLSRENYEVVFFRTKQYCKWGEPVMQVQNHYFSKY